MELEELQEKYKSIPQELKDMRRWVIYRCEERDGKMTKVPVNAISNNYAKCNDSITWTSFKNAINGCTKYNAEGLGFMLGEGIIGIDLDNHGDCTQEEFDNVAKDFLNNLNTYSEYSRSKKGIHILCKGTLPEGRRRKGIVEIYSSGRFFAMTGYSIKERPIEETTEPLKVLWEKYVDDSKEIAEQQAKYQTNNLNGKYSFLNYDADYKEEQKLSDNELIRKACDSKGGTEFASLYHGDISGYNDDHSAADMAFCQKLAFWCNSDKQQMDRIFRSSGLMRPKWDEMRGYDTYGNITLDKACRSASNGYVNLINTYQYQNNTPINFSTTCSNDKKENNNTLLNIDENGNPIFRIKKIFHRYSLDDTGNAQRFYDYFGDLFKYNKTDKIFMFWTGKTWTRDTKDIIRKYANKMIEILKEEEKDLKVEQKEAKDSGEIGKAEELENIIKACQKNTARFSNKAGKDAMLSEFQSIENIAVETHEFDKDPYILNTNSGVIDLRKGEISPFEPSLMLSKNTNTSVSFEEPETWVKFLHSIFKREKEEEETEIIDCIQRCVGYSLSGLTAEQCMFICYGSGSNGKSTFSEQIARILGDYGSSTPSSTLIQQKNGNNAAAIFSLAKLKGSRYVEMGETDEGEKLAEATIKRLTGGDTISAQFKYGNEFDFKPTFKIWMATNNKPIIRGTDLGIWRRIFPFPFLRTFTDKEKDRSLPGRLAEESDKILGWAIKGFQKYYKEGKIEMPNCLKSEVEQYKAQMDVIAQFIRKQCNLIENYKTPCRNLYQNYKMWGKDSTEYIMSERRFEEELKNRGIYEIEYNGEPHFIGIKLNTDRAKAYVFNSYDDGDYYD